MGAAAGLHYHRTGRYLRQCAEQLAAVGFLAQYLMTFGILAMQVETVFANVDTEKRHRIHERSSAENEKSPASVNLQGFSVRLTISLSPAMGAGL
jgi:archaellum component FlaF (FlaF/FlaG flagellin family)